jgi:protein O-mannosyl-transferase
MPAPAPSPVGAARVRAAGPAAWLAPAAIVLAALAAYADALGTPFVFDDLLRIPRNPFIRALWPPWTPLLHTSRPLTQWTLALNYAWTGLAPWSYHALNVVIHALAALALLDLARRTLARALPPAAAGRAPALAFAIALLWAVHPLGSQAVIYVIQRSESLMALFYLLALGALERAAAAEGHAPRARRWEGVAVACALLGAASKTVIVSLPLVALLYDRAYLAGSFRAALRARGRAHAGFALAALAALALLAAAPEEWRRTAGIHAHGVTWARYLVSEPGVILHYLRLALWPAPLVFDYGWPPVPTFAAGHHAERGPVPGVALEALGVLAIVAWFRRRAVGFLALAFFLILAPTSGLVPISDLAFEHRMYLPLAAIVALAVIAVDAALRARLPAGAARGLGLALLVAATLALARATAARTRDYASALTLWTDTVAKRPENARARNNLGKALEDADRIGEALEQYRAAARLDSTLADARSNLGHALDLAGQPEEAIAEYRAALRFDPDHAWAHCNLGAALARRGDLAAAAAELDAALRLDPEFPEANYNRGLLLARSGQFEAAAAAYRAALAARPDYADAHLNLGVTLARTGDLRGAVDHLGAAVRLTPASVEARYDLGHALALAGDRAGAVRELTEARRLDPAFEPARRELDALGATSP